MLRHPEPNGGVSILKSPADKTWSGMAEIGKYCFTASIDTTYCTTRVSYAFKDDKLNSHTTTVHVLFVASSVLPQNSCELNDNRDKGRPESVMRMRSGGVEYK